MTLPKEVLDQHVALLNKHRREDERVKLEHYEEPGRFTLSFPNRPMVEGECIDQDFTEIQFALHEKHRVDTGIQGGRHDPASDRYFVDYEVIEWD